MPLSSGHSSEGLTTPTRKGALRPLPPLRGMLYLILSRYQFTFNQQDFSTDALVAL
jgi:hypothetical protein